MTSQPEPPWNWPGGAGRDRDAAPPGDASSGHPGYAEHYGPAVQPGGRRPRRRKSALFALLLVVGLGGLAVAAVGMAHRILPRQFTPAQQREITGWEMARRWRALPAGTIFPASVSYTVPGTDLDSIDGLKLTARRLAISQPESCAAAFTAAAGRILDRYGCTTVLRATYVDASGSMVATVAVAVLPAKAPASVVLTDLQGTQAGAAGPVLTFPVPGTSAAAFGTGQRQLSAGISAGPYVILSTAGFADDRTEQVSGDNYVSGEMTSLADGLVNSAERVLGRRPRPPTCPGAPGC